MSDYIYVAIAFAAAAIIIFIRLKFMIKGEKVMARVTDYICPKGAYIPIMEFEYEGQIMNIKAKNGWKKQKYDIGSELEIYYIPGNENEVKIVHDYSDIIMMAVFLICGAVIFYCLKNMHHHKM